MTKPRIGPTPAQNPFTQNPFTQNPFTQGLFTQGPFTQGLFTQGLFAGAENPFAAFTPPLDLVAKGHGQAAQAWMQLNRAVLEGIGKIQQEASRFVIRRLEEDVEHQQQILASRSPEDALQVCADYARQTVQDYTDEAGRLSEIAAEVQHACSGFGEMLAASTIEPAPSGPARKSAA